MPTDNKSTIWLYEQLTKQGYQVGRDVDEFDNLMRTNKASREWAYTTAKAKGLNVGKDQAEFDSLVAPQAASSKNEGITVPLAPQEIGGWEMKTSTWRKEDKNPAGGKEAEEPARMLTPEEMSDFLQGERERIAAGTADVIERSKRIADRNTPQGRQATREAEWAAQVAGTPTRVLGVPKAAVKDESPTGDAPVQEQEQVKASGQSPVPHGVVYEDGKPRTEWVLPDGSLTTSRMDAEHAEYAARQARDEQRLADRMRTLGLDPEQPEDVQTEYLLKEKRRIEAEMGKRGKELDVESAGFSWRDMPRGGGALVHTYNSTTVNGRLADPAYKALTAQLHQVNEGLAVLDASKRNKAADRWIDDSSNWAARKAKQLAAFGIGSWRGLAHAVGKVSTWDMGMTDMANNAMLYQAATDADRQGIDNISQEERDLLNLAANTNAIQAKYGKDLGYGYAAGNITGESLPFMMEFILNPASRLGQTAVNRMMRVAVERYGKAAVKAAAKKYLAAKIGTRVAGDIAGAAVMASTTGQGRVTADMLNRMTGDVQFREDGNGRIVYDGREGAEDSMATALLKAFGAQTIENHSEMLGTYFAPILGKAAKLGRKGMEKIGLGKVNRLIDDLGATNVARMLDDFKKRTRWNGTVEEYAEEVAGGIENALLVGDNTLDTEEGRGVFNREENIKTFLGVGLMGGFLAGAKMVSYRGPKRRALDEMSEAGKAIDSALEGNYPLMEQWGKWRNTFLIGTDEEKESALREVMNNEELPWAFRKGVLGFVKAAQKYEGLSRAQENKVENGEQEPAARMYDASYDTGYETTDPEGMEAVRSRMEAERKRLAEILGLDNPSEVDGHIGDSLGFVEEQRKLGDEERVQAAVDYANARSAYEGMVQRMRDDIDGRIEQSNRIVDERTNHDTGMIQGIIMKKQDENHNDRRGYVLSGNLVMLPDGTGIDHDKSDGSIIVRDADTGAMEMVSPEVILRMEQPVDPETEKMTAAEAIRQQYGQQEANRIDGRVAQASPSLSADEQTGSSEQPEYALNYGVTLRNDDGSLTEGIVVDANYDDGYMLVQIDTPQGERVIPYSREELDNRMQEVRNEDGHTLWKTGEASGNSSTQNGNIELQNIPVSSETFQAGASVWSALERIPKDKQGQPLYEQTDPETAWDAIVEQTGGDEEIVGEVVADLVEEQDKALKAAEKELKKVQEGKPQQKKGDAPLTMDERIAAKKVAKEQLSQAQANVDVAKKRLAIWRNIANTPIRRKQAALAAQSKAAEEAAQLRRAEEEKLRAEREEAERIRREALNGVPDFIEDTPQDARARGYRRVNGNKVDRQQAIPAKQGNEVQVKFDDNNIPTGHVALIDASQLQPSHINGLSNPLHFIDEAQPKERNDEASVMSARKIAANIRPEEITSSVTAYTGAPTVNSRGEVIQGNNRSAALREMWAAHLEQAARYKQYLTEHAADFGLTPEDVETMQQPVLVNMLDVTDDEAITLGQFVAQDTESGGTERIKPKNIVQKMGNDMRSFAGQLLASPDEEMSFAELVDRNGPGVLKWMQQKGYITPTQYKSAFDSKGGLTAETKNDLKGVMYQSIFQNGNTHLEEMFNALPVKAQKAILATAYRDYDSPNAERMNAEIQDSINAYYALSQDVAFAGAKNYKEARMAAEAWKRQLAFDDVTGESYLPSERYSNFALLLATMYKGQSQTFIQNTFKNIFDLVQGTQEMTLFDEPDNTPRTLVEAINETLSNLREELLLNGNFIYNGQRRSNVLAVGSAAGQQGRQGSDGSATSGGRNENTARTDDSSGRTEISVEQGQTKGSDNSQLEGNSSSKQEEYTLSSKQSGNGEHFYQDASGNIDLVDIPQEVFDEIGYSKAPFRLTPSMILHVLNGHGKELGVSTVEDTVRFVLDVMTHFDHVRLGYDGALIFSIENGRKRTGKRAVTILINSDNGKFYGLKTSGYETVNGLSKRPLLWERGAKKESSTTDAASASVSTGKSPLSGEQSGSASHQSKSHSKNDEAHILHATDEQSAETVGASQEVEQSGTTTSSRMNAPASNIVPETPVKTEPQQPNNAVSTGSSLSENERGGITSSEPNGKPTVSFHKETDKSSVTQIIGEKIAKTEEETEQREAELASRVEVSDDDWQEGDTDKPIYKRSIIIDGKHTATQVDQPDENGHYIGSYFVFDNKRFGDIAEIVDYIDNGQALATKIAQAEAETNTEPTERQKEAGNYKKGHVRIGQFDITVENPKGSVRRGVDASGKAWEHTMQNTYGYIRGTEGVDGDHIDVFLTNDIDGWNGRRVYIVDQYNEDGTFDEHKVMLGFNDEADAQDAYLSNYEKGWEYKHKLVMSSVNLPDFEKWINSSHRKTKPFAEYKSVNKANVANETNAPDAGFEIAPTQYTTKRGKVLDMFLVTFAEPLTKEQQRAAKELAKAEKGWYDRDKGGFMMRSEESARKLADTITGNEEVVSNAQPLSIADIRKLEEPAMRQVDVEGLMQAIRENGEAKLSEHYVPQSEQKEDISTRETQSNPKNSGQFGFVSDERMEEIKRRLKMKRGQLNMGLDPETMLLGIELTLGYIDRGIKKFADYAKVMIDEVGNEYRPYLKMFYNGVRESPEAQESGLADEMTPYDEVRTFDVANFDKGHSDALATAEMVVQEQEVNRQADEAKEKLIEQRNEQRRKEDEQTTADTEAIASKAESVASQAESDIEAATTERQVNYAVENIDKQLEEVNRQLALLGYYEAEPVESDFNEAYGYMRNAEKKAVRDANRLAKRLVNDLGIDPNKIVDKKGKKRRSIATANITLVGGDISIYLPLSSEANLYLSIGLATSYERNASTSLMDRGKGGRWEGDNLEVERIMYRIEQPDANGNERYGNNNFADADVTYSDLLKDIRRISKKYITVNEEVKEGNDTKQEALTKADKKPGKRQKKQDEPKIADLFSDQQEGISSESQEAVNVNTVTYNAENTEINRKFADAVKTDMLSALDSGTKPYRSILDLRKRASGLGMEVDNDGRTDILLQELAEDGLVRAAREVVERYGSDSREAYGLICKLYEMQPTIAARSSNRIKMQQYSTPLPMAWNAVRFAMTGKKDGKVLEPTAGNGMLVFAIPAGQVHANELDGTRLANLREQGFAQVTQQDATEPFEGGKQYDAVVANPPFGKREAVDYDGKLISGLDPQITLNALASMKDDGRAAIIIGGNMEYASNGGLKSMKPFFTYLYDHYNVKGVVDMDGSLYAKQGTTYPTRMILIDGRRSEEERAQSAVYPPVQSKAIRKGDSFEALYDIIEEIINSKEKTNGTEILRSQQGQLLPVADQPSRNADRERHTEQPRKDDAGRPGGRTSVERTQEPGEVVLRGEHRTDIGDGETRRRTGGNTGGGSRGVSEPDVQRVETVGVSTERVGLEPTSTEQPKRRTLTEEKSAYRPHNSAFSLQSVAPAAMVEAMDRTLSLIEKKYGHIDEFVRKELGYDTTDELHQALAAEQVDSVAMAIYQMKQGQALIIGDQTGVGKGRQMAALIRWAVRQGEKPIFITQKADLFSDIYRDLVDIGSGDLVPFIFNSPSAKENKGEMVDANGKVVYKGLSDAKMKKVLATGKLPDECDYAVLTYSQVNTGDEVSQKEMEEAAKKNKTRSKKSKSAKDGKATPKATFLRAIAEDNYLFLDESHTAAGSSNTGAYLQGILRSAKAATFASATFAKRPDTMPLYAIRTAMSQAKVEPDKLISIIEKGGVTLQEIMSRELTNAGQMVRRERDMSDVVTDWKTINDPETVRRARENYDRTIAAFNAIIKFQEDYVKPMVDTMDKELAAMAESAGIKRGTDKMGIDNVPFASKTYNYTKQLMLALKVDAIANEVDTEIKAGRHPVIALESTMESSIKDYSAGEVIVEPTFSASLLRGLDTVMQYTIKDENGKEQHARYSPKQLGEAGEKAYYELQDFIRESTSDIFISPLDAIIERLHEMGYKIGELTGRNMYVERDDKDRVVVKRRTDKDKKRMQREFNNGELDVLILNKSASTGISLHASEKFSDQRQRTMIIAQPLSDINDYMQMIGRIDRTGQVHRGYYINLGLPVPAENRFLMMLSTKLKSLNANTTTSQDSESNEVEAPDLLNKYGSQVVVEYLRDNPDVYDKMGRPLKKNGENGGTVSIAELDEYKPQEDDARKITGYVALLNTQEQEEFYDDVIRRYNELIKYLNDTGNNDLKITVMPLRAKTLEKRVSSEGIDPTGTNPFAQNSYVEQVEMDVLRKPMKAAEIRKTIEQVNKGKRPEDYIRQVISTIEKEDEARIAAEEARYERSKVRAQEDIAKQTEKINRQQKRSAEEKQAAIADYAKETHENVEAKHSDNLVRLNTNSDMLKQRLRMFEVGKSYLMPDNLETMAFDFSTPAIFCGYKAKDSKITASTTFAVFATLDGRRRVEVKLSDIAALRSIYKTTNDNWDAARSTTLDNWDSQIPTGTRKTGYIMTGNILQAIADTQDERGGFPGQLISYTDIDGNVHDGILMPDKWNRSMLKTSGSPIISRLKQIKDYQPVTSHDGKVEITGSSWARMYYLTVPKTKKDGSVYYENNAILNAVHGHNFYPYRGKLRADITEKNIESVVKELSKLGVKVQEEAKEDDVLYRLDDYMTNGEEANDLLRRNVREKGIKIADKNWVLTAYNKDAPATTKAPVDGTYGSTAVAPGTSSAAKVVESFENSSVEEDNLRDGDGALTDDELSMTNDPVSKVLGKSVRTVQEYKRFAERERARMIAHIQELAEKLHLDNVEIVTDASTLEGRRGKAKGFYSRSTGKITIVIPNHSSVFDAEQTLLHEAVAHYGLRQLFGEHFDTFLDNVFQNADTDVRRHIVELAEQRSWDFRTATEEYLASLAENTNFENVNASWWSKIKELFLRMLHKISFENFSGVTLSDNELRYILWRSYENLAEPGRYRSILGEAADVAKQHELKVGNYADTKEGALHVADRKAKDKDVTEVHKKSTKVERLRKLRESTPVTITGEEYKGKYELNRDSAKQWIKDNLRGTYVNEDTGDKIELSKVGANKVTSHGERDEAHLKSIVAIPQLIEKSIFIAEQPNEKGNDKYDSYRYYVCGLNIAGEDYTAKIVIGVKGDSKYYDHRLTRIEKGTLIDNLNGMAKSVVMNQNPLISGIKDTKLLSILQADEDIMFRNGDEISYEGVRARATYESRVRSGMFQMQEALQDSMLGLKEGMRAVLAAEGDGKRIEEVDGFENAYLGENRLSSVNQAEADAFARLLFKPLTDVVSRLAHSEEERVELTDYMMAKHGLERNAYMRHREAEKAALADVGTRPKEPLSEDEEGYDEKMEAVKDWERLLEKQTFQYESEDRRDYAGLTALTETGDVWAAEEQARNMVDEYESRHDTAELWRRTKDVNEAILSKLYESGMLGHKTYEYIRSMYEFYIPLRGFDEKTSREAYAYLRDRNSAFNAPIKKAKGRRSKADDPLAYLQSMAESAIMQGNRNVLVKQRFLNFVLNHPSDLVSVSELWLKLDGVTGEWRPVLPEIDTDDSAETVAEKTEAFERRMEQLAKDFPDKYKRGKDAENIPYRVVDSRDLHEHQVVVKRGGRDVVLTVNGNPRLAQALNGQTNPDNDVSGGIGRVMQWGEAVNRQLSAFYTTRNPDFVVSNFLRDALYANSMVWVKEGRNYALLFHNNFRKVNPVQMRILFGKYMEGTLDEKDPMERMFKQFMLNGGETGYTHLRDIDARKSAIRRELRKANGQIPLRTVWDALGEQFDLMNRSVENCARFAAFMTSRQMGRSVDRAIYDAKEISVNFNKKGSGAKFLDANGQTYLGQGAALVSVFGRSGFVFWNAAIQGSTNFGRQLKRHPVKALTAMGTMFLLGAAVAALGVGGGGDDDDKNAYFNLPGYVRRSNLMFRAGDQWICIPLPVEYRAVYGMGELMVSSLSGRERLSAGELAKEMAKQMTQVLPLDVLEGDGGLGAFMPSAVKPMYEAYVNRSWTGLPIYKDTPYNRTMPEWTKAYRSANTSLVELSKVLNEASGGDAYTSGVVDVNPAVVEHLLKGYFGGFASTLDKLVKTGETVVGSREYDPRSILLLNRVVKNGDERTESRALNEAYFRLREEHDKLRKRLRNYERDTVNGVFDYAEKIDFLHNSPEYRRYEIFESYRSDIDDLYNLLKEADANGDKEAVKDIEAQLNEVKKMMIKDMNATRK